MTAGTDRAQAAPAEPLHDAHVACWWDQLDLNERAIAAYEREHGLMTEDQRRMVR